MAPAAKVATNTHVTRLSVSDSSANIAAQLDDLNDNTKITSLTQTGTATALGITAEQMTRNAAALGKIVEERSWLSHLCADEATRSKTSVCLSVEGADEAFIKAMAGTLEKEGAAFDIAGYRDAPPGLRIWCGATVNVEDIEALGPWLDWAYAATKAA